MIWENMIRRCTNPDHQSYEYYGGRGISVCPEWIADFQAFFDCVGERPSPQHTLDREDNTLGYMPGNVKWATKKEQSLNVRKVNALSARIDYLESLLEEAGIKYD